MERLSDTITSVFHIAIENSRPVVCSSGDGTIVWSDTFGLGWRFGISYNPQQWFPKVHLYLDHNHSHTDQDQATAIVSVGDTADKAKAADGFKGRMVTIRDFGHGQHAPLGSWSTSILASHPFVSLTLTTKARLPQPAMDPLSSAASAIRESMVHGDFVDTKFHVFSAKRSGKTAGKPRVVYANSNSIGLALPALSSAKEANGSTPRFLRNMTDDHHINEDSLLHDYDYEQDSDLDDGEEDGNDSDRDDDEEGEEDNTGDEHDPREWQTGSSSRPRTFTGSTQANTQDSLKEEIPAEPPAYTVSSTRRTILVKGVAYKTWLSYIYFRYTGQAYFLPLKSARGSSGRRPKVPSQPPRCSPKSMYRLADSLGDNRMKELALRAIKEGLSKDNIVEEALSWFTAQYPAINKHEVEEVSKLRKSPEVSSALKVQLKVVTHGEKPWAYDALFAIMEKLIPSEPTS